MIRILGQPMRILATLLALASGCGGDSPNQPPDDEECPKQLHAVDVYPAWSPEGTKIAFMSSETDTVTAGINDAIVVLHLPTQQRDTLLTGRFLYVNSIDWSPDETSLVLSSSYGIQILEIGSDSLRTIKTGEFHTSASWSGASGKIYFSNGEGVYIGLYSVNPDGGELTRLTERRHGIVAPWVFDDSDSLACFAHLSNPRLLCIGVIAAGDTALTDTVLCGLSDRWRVQMHPNHRTIIYSVPQPQCGPGPILACDRLTGDVDTVVSAFTYNFDVSPDGRWVVYTDRQETGGLRMINLETKEVRQLTRGQ